jgi:hypothetical protein
MSVTHPDWLSPRFGTVRGVGSLGVRAARAVVSAVTNDHGRRQPSTVGLRAEQGAGVDAGSERSRASVTPTGAARQRPVPGGCGQPASPRRRCAWLRIADRRHGRRHGAAVDLARTREPLRRGAQPREAAPRGVPRSGVGAGPALRGAAPLGQAPPGDGGRADAALPGVAVAPGRLRPRRRPRWRRTARRGRSGSRSRAPRWRPARCACAAPPTRSAGSRRCGRGSATASTGGRARTARC